MNKAETAGESSSKEQENGDGTNESERPLKKARFAWQVKGKYHLKNNNKDAAKPATVTLPDPNVAGSSSSTSRNSSSGNEQNLEALGDYLMNQDLKALDSVISPPDNSVLSPSTSVSNERLPYPRYVSSCERSRGCRIIDMNTYADSVLFAPSSAEDLCINRWQTRQMVKSFVDNSINKVLDRWAQGPPDDAFQNIALEVADFINNLPGDNSVENEGILMAISAHGLQQTSSTVITRNFIEHDYTHSSSNNNDNLCSLKTTYCEATVPSDDESHEPINAKDQNDSDASSERCSSPWSILADDKDDSSDTTHYPLFPDVTDMSYGGVNDSHQNPSSEFQGMDNQNNNDFLDHAIMFAIQSQGLTTFGSEYG